jgi:hypothetical protein
VSSPNPRRTGRLAKRRRRESQIAAPSAAPLHGEVVSHDVPVIGEPPHIHPAAGTAGNPNRALIDALLEVMDPYLDWPDPGEPLDDLADELTFGALVWNIVAFPASAQTTDALLTKIAARLAHSEDEAADVRAHVDEIAARKRQMAPEDLRQVVRIDVGRRDGRVEVRAASAW